MRLTFIHAVIKVGKVFLISLAAALLPWTAGPGFGQDQNIDDAFFEVLIGKNALSSLALLDSVAQAQVLIRFVQQGDAKRVAELHWIDPNQRTPDGTLPLHAAIVANEAEIVELLLKAGADPERRSGAISAVDLARTSTSPRIRELLLGEDISTAVQLEEAARKNDVTKLMALLIQADADEALVPALVTAVMAGSEEAAAALLLAGADANGQTKEGLNPLGAAVMEGEESMVKRLLESGASPDATLGGMPLLSLAISIGAGDIFRLLLEAGADPTQKGADGAIPAQVALALGRDDLLDELGGLPSPKPKVSLIDAIQSGDHAAVRQAIATGADPNQRLPDGTPLLVYAAHNAPRSVVEAFLSYRHTDLSATTPDGIDPLQAALASMHKDHKRISILPAFFTSRSHETQLRPLLLRRDQNGRSSLVKIALLQGPFLWIRDFFNRHKNFLNRADPDGVTPITAAILTDNYNFVEYLTKNDLIPETLLSGLTPQDLARQAEKWNMLTALPDDRVIPQGVKKGASIQAKKEMQRQLKEWGYYTGEIDGIFGAGSRAAMGGFLIDRGKELLEIALASGRRLDSKTSEGDTVISYAWKPKGSWCYWTLAKWNYKDNLSEYFIGCVKGSPEWNSNGVAYVEFKNANKDVFLFGEDGWNGNVLFK